MSDRIDLPMAEGQHRPGLACGNPVHFIAFARKVALKDREGDRRFEYIAAFIPRLHGGVVKTAREREPCIEAGSMNAVNLHTRRRINLHGIDTRLAVWSESAGNEVHRRTYLGFIDGRAYLYARLAIHCDVNTGFISIAHCVPCLGNEIVL